MSRACGRRNRARLSDRPPAQALRIGQPSATRGRTWIASLAFCSRNLKTDHMPLLLGVCPISDSTKVIFVLAILRLLPAAPWNEIALCGFPGRTGDEIMPRYFFHLSFGQRTVPEVECVVMTTHITARHVELWLVRDLAYP